MEAKHIHESFQQKLKVLQEGYAKRLPNKIQDIETTWHHVLETEGEEQAVQAFHRLVHSIAGSGGNYGFVQTGRNARELELFIKDMLENTLPMTTEHQAHIAGLLDRLKTAMHQELVQDVLATQQDALPTQQDTLSEPAPNLPNPPNREEPRAETQSSVPIFCSGVSHTNCFPIAHDACGPETYQPENRCIYLVEDDTWVAEDLKLQIGHFGYTVQVFEHPSHIKHALSYSKPAAVVMDVMFPDGLLGGQELAVEIRALCQQVPVMFMSARDDVMARLQAVRAGGMAYFTKPVNVSALIDKLDEMTTDRQPEPYRVLIIDDEQDMTAMYDMFLRRDGIDTVAINDPMHMMQPLHDFRPDLILMDLYMPGCNGLELASVIRQQETFVGIPIVFLSAETNLEQQLIAMNRGGDDFLTKPIDSNHLISIVNARAQRSRDLRASMIRDSLTGLLNHTTTKEALHREVLYASRRKSAISFAMIDLDKFKSVNDTYGHPAGDRVIKSLSRVLQQRLRKTDIIGRYGGEEFAVMLPDTEGKHAVQVLDEIRNDFSQIRQRAEEREFSVTFSCGIADFPSYTDAAIINKAADEALYEAKHRGRNCVILR